MPSYDITALMTHDTGYLAAGIWLLAVATIVVAPISLMWLLAFGRRTPRGASRGGRR